MSYALAADEPAPPETEAMVLSRVNTNTMALLQWTRDEDKRRTIALIVGGISALFAAVKLGWVVIPHIRKRRATLGTLGAAPAMNPRRRRRR